jgi:hypothetical protein
MAPYKERDKRRGYCKFYARGGPEHCRTTNCPYRHEMPIDEKTQQMLGLLNGVPEWYHREGGDNQPQTQSTPMSATSWRQQSNPETLDPAAEPSNLLEAAGYSTGWGRRNRGVNSMGDATRQLENPPRTMGNWRRGERSSENVGGQNRRVKTSRYQYPPGLSLPAPTPRDRSSNPGPSLESLSNGNINRSRTLTNPFGDSIPQSMSNNQNRPRMITNPFEDSMPQSTSDNQNRLGFAITHTLAADDSDNLVVWYIHTPKSIIHGTTHKNRDTFPEDLEEHFSLQEAVASDILQCFALVIGAIEALCKDWQKFLRGSSPEPR